MDLIIVTGATKGLGLAICKRLLKENYRVVGISRDKSDAFQKLQDENNDNLFLKRMTFPIHKRYKASLER